VELHAHVPLLIASCAPCDGADGLATGNGSAGITVAESASAVATIAADFIRRFFPYYLRRHDFGERRHRGLARAAYSITSASASGVGGRSTLSQTLTYVRGGKLKALAVMAKTRWPALPDVPTTDEVGAPGMYISFWHGLWVPKGTPRQVIGKLNSAVIDALADANVRKRLTDLGLVIATREQQTPAALAAYQKAEIEKWWPIIRAANIKVESH